MNFSLRSRYVLITTAVVTASCIQLVRGYRPLIVLVAAITFLLVGNLTVYVSGSKTRALRRQNERDYWAGGR